MRGERHPGKSKAWTVLLILLFLGLIVVGIRFLPVSEVKVEGLELVEEEAFLREVLPEDGRSFFHVLKLEILGKKVPGIRSFSVSFSGLDSVKIHVVEEEGIAVARAEGDWLVLSETGAVLKIMSSNPGNLIGISGCGINRAELLKVPETQDREAFTGLLTYAGLMVRLSLSAASLRYGNGEYQLFLGNTVVNLGGLEYGEEKLLVVSDQKEKYEGLTGILHLENYEPGAARERYLFEVTEGK